MTTTDFWRKCNMCKKQIGFKSVYWVCNVSTCNRKRTGLVFCDVSCWDAHLPMMNHRESWAEERRSPSREDWEKIQAGEMEEPRPKKEKAPSDDTEAPAPKSSSTTPAKPIAAPAPILRKRSQ